MVVGHKKDGAQLECRGRLLPGGNFWQRSLMSGKEYGTIMSLILSETRTAHGSPDRLCVVLGAKPWVRTSPCCCHPLGGRHMWLGGDQSRQYCQDLQS